MAPFADEIRNKAKARERKREVEREREKENSSVFCICKTIVYDVQEYIFYASLRCASVAIISYEIFIR